MTMTAARMKQLILDICNKVPAPPDEDAETRRIRARLTRQIHDIVAAGAIVEIPGEVE